MEDLIKKAAESLKKGKLPEQRTLERLASFVNLPRDNTSARQRAQRFGKNTRIAGSALKVLQDSARKDPVKVGKIVTNVLKNEGIGRDWDDYRVPDGFFDLAMNLPVKESSRIQFLLAAREGKINSLPPMVLTEVILSDDFDDEYESFSRWATDCVVGNLFSQDKREESALILNAILGKSIKKIETEDDIGWSAHVSPSSIFHKYIHDRVFDSMYTMKDKFKYEMNFKTGVHGVRFALGHMIAKSLPKGVKLAKVLEPLTQKTHFTEQLDRWLESNPKQESTPPPVKDKIPEYTERAGLVLGRNKI